MKSAKNIKKRPILQKNFTKYIASIKKMCYNKNVLNDMIGEFVIMFGSTKKFLWRYSYGKGYGEVV